MDYRSSAVADRRTSGVAELSPGSPVMQGRNTRSRRNGGITCAGSLSGISIRAPFGDRDPEILTPECLGFVRALVGEFAGPIRTALSKRAARHERIARGMPIGCSCETRAVRDVEWRVADLPHALDRRLVEVAGPPDRGAIAAARAAGADAFVADFEDAVSPTWAACLEGQISLRDAVRASGGGAEVGGGAEAGDAEDAEYTARNAAGRPVLFVRPRALHLVEGHMRLDGRPVPAALFDFGLFFFHNALPLARRDAGPFFYLPKLESHQEARIWSRVFSRAEQLAGLPGGTVRATVHIETVPAAFEMDEILWELRHHGAGLACGYPGYLFSFIKTRRDDHRAILPDLAAADPLPPCLRAFTRLLVQTAHRRGAPAMGGILGGTLKDVATDASGALITAARQEADAGLDGIRVADSGAVSAARATFLDACGNRNQREIIPEGRISASDLLRVPDGPRTERALRRDVRMSLRSIAAWLSGEGPGGDNGAEAMSATEFRRSRIWQLIRHQAVLDDGSVVTAGSVRRVMGEETLRLLRERSGKPGTDRLPTARTLLERLCCSEELEEFLAVPAYNLLEDGV